MSTPDPVPFDTHRFVKRMTEAGMPLAQAEALAEEQGVIVNTHFATKQDTDELKHRLANVEHNLGGLTHKVGDLTQDVGGLTHKVGGLTQDVGGLTHKVGGLTQDVGELKIGLAVVKAELTMVKWMVSGVGFGMLLLLVRTFWPV